MAERLSPQSSLNQQLSMGVSPEAAKSSISNGKKKGRALALVPSFAVRKGLRRERSQRAADVSFTQSLQSPVPKLTDALTGNSEQRANLLERVLSPTLEPKVQTKDLGIPRRQRRKRRLDLIVEEAVHCFLLGVRHLVGDEPLDQRPIAFRIHRRVEPHVAGVERGERLNDVHRQPGELGQLFGSRLAPHLLAEDLRRLDDARQIRGPVERNAHRPTLPRERGKDRLADPPYGVRNELDSLIRIELPGSREQTDVAFTDKVDERHAAVLVFLGHGDHEAEIPLHELLERVGITRANSTGDVDLLGAFEQRIGANLVQILIEDIPLGLAWRYSGDGRFAATLYFSHWCIPQVLRENSGGELRPGGAGKCGRMSVTPQPVEGISESTDGEAFFSGCRSAARYRPSRTKP